MTDLKNIQSLSDVEAVKVLTQRYQTLTEEIAKVIVGQDDVVKNILIGIFSRGHCLLIGVPGLAKTLLISTISELLDLKSSRIQFTPDLMPSDITGSEILTQQRDFQFIKGPIFSNIILADEINRTPPKTQSALLEAMQEKAVTIAGKSYPLQEPFFVLATQNPIEQEGTYPLPEAQLDRFMFNIYLDYPSHQEEVMIVKNTTSDKKVTLSPVMDAEEIMFFQHLIRRIPVTDHVLDYAVSIVSATRRGRPEAHEWSNKYLTWGAGPRASQYLIIGAKCHAALHGKYAPDEEDVRAVAIQVLRHRLVKNYKAEAEGLDIQDIITEIIKQR